MEHAQHPTAKDCGERDRGHRDRGGISHASQKRTVDELAAEQGIAVPQRLDEMNGVAAEFWNDDRDIDRFVQGIYDRRLERRVSDEDNR